MLAMRQQSVVFILLVCLCGVLSRTQAQQTVNRLAAPGQTAAPQFDQWGDDFSAGALDETKWERFTFEGGGGGKLEVRDGQLQIRSANKTRSGVRSKPTFTGDRFSVEATVAKVGAQLP